MINAVIVDDEKNCIEILEWKLKHFCPEVNVVKTFNDPRICLEYLKNNSIDLLFLDVEMPQMTGFELIDELDNIDFKVIVITAFQKYDIKAEKLNYCKFLLKPVRNKDLISAVDLCSSN